MPTNMNDPLPSTYRIVAFEPSKSLAVVRGSLPRSLRKAESRQLIQREAHAFVLKLTEDGIPVDRYDWWADLRRGQLKLVGGLLRFIDSVVAKGWSEERIQMLPGWLSWYIHDRCLERSPDPTPPGANRRAA